MPPCPEDFRLIETRSQMGVGGWFCWKKPKWQHEYRYAHVDEELTVYKTDILEDSTVRACVANTDEYPAVEPLGGIPFYGRKFPKQLTRSHWLHVFCYGPSRA